jgi:hypothetical protein
MPQRDYSREKTKAAKSSKRIWVPISRESYDEIIEDREQFREVLGNLIECFPELFPEQITGGYHLYGFERRSVKMADVRLRRICLNEPDERGCVQVYTIAPSFVMPYMVGYTDDIEKALFLRRFGVPFWGLTYVFGRDDMYWQRIVMSVGRNEIVGTTVKDPDKLPEHLLADEKHTRFNGEKAYIATTVAEDCVLGASLALAADEAQLTEAYGHFKQEAQHLDPDYQPQTVNTDGWSATQLAWQALFPAVTLILCFLHAFLSIRSRAKHLKEVWNEIQQRVWDIYHAEASFDFLKQVAALQLWATDHVTGPTLKAIHKLCDRADRFVLAFDHPDAYRTSNMLDRQLDPFDRCLYAARYFHGHLMSAEYQIRTWALFHNFLPYCPRARIRETYQSPFHKLNGFVYHENWLHNLLIASSLGGRHAYQCNPLE